VFLGEVKLALLLEPRAGIVWDEEPGTLSRVRLFSLVPLVGNRTQNSRVAGARPNHQPIGGSDANHQGIWSPPRAGHVPQPEKQLETPVDPTGRGHCSRAA
jgi:hypothetical protein